MQAKNDLTGLWLTLIVDTAVLIFLSCHEGINLSLSHLLSCRRRQKTSNINNTQSDTSRQRHIRQDRPSLTHPVLKGQYAAQPPSLCRCLPCQRHADPQRSPQNLPCSGCWWWTGAWAGSPQTLLFCCPCLYEKRNNLVQKVKCQKSWWQQTQHNNGNWIHIANFIQT